MAGPELLRQANGAGNIDAGRAAEAEPLVFDQVEDERQRLFIRDQVGFVDFETLDDRRDPAESDAFGNRAAFGRFGFAILEQMIHRRAARIGAPGDDVFLFLAQISRDAGQRAAGADGANEAIDAAAALLPDLRTGGDVMRLAIVEIVPLVGEDDAVLFRLLQLFR